MKLSKEIIKTFCGDVVTIKLCGGQGKEVLWRSSDSNAIFTRTYKDALPDPFSDRVILVLKKAGEYKVFATCDGEEFECTVSVREMRKYKKGEKLNFYCGDFHNHTSQDHNPETYRKREEGLPAEAIKVASDNGKIDAISISDHGDISDNNDFFRTVEAAESYEGEMVVFGGMENEINLIEEDIYGKPYKNAGEIVSFNCDNYAFTPTWDEFFERMGESPMPIGKFAHPQVLGFGKAGIWNFNLREKADDRMRNFFRLTEMGNGTTKGSNLIHEYAYSEALDWGFKISPDCSSDSHGPIWGYESTIGKTIILSPEKSKEMFIDAIRNNRVYATESGNVKLFYSVNGYICGESLPLCSEYEFSIDIDCFNNEKECPITKLEIISDYGKAVYKKEGKIEKNEKIKIKSDTARYFYIRLCDAEGYRTWSSPVWTRREFDKCEKINYTPVNSLLKSAKDLKTGKDAAALINGDIYDVWEGEGQSAEIEIELSKAEKIDAVGLYQYQFTTGQLNEISPGNIDPIISHFVSSFPRGYEIYTAAEDKLYKKAAENHIRIFGEEHKAKLSGETIKYIKIKILTTAGSVYEKQGYNENVKLAEINVYKKDNL